MALSLAIPSPALLTPSVNLGIHRKFLLTVPLKVAGAISLKIAQLRKYVLAMYPTYLFTAPLKVAEAISLKVAQPLKSYLTKPLKTVQVVSYVFFAGGHYVMKKNFKQNEARSQAFI